jgi:mono/diheme cytochrome c family protein
MNNRRFARTVGWLALPCLVAAGLLAWYVTREPASPFAQEAAASNEPALVSRGEYVARLSDCVACHSLQGPFAGGLEMATPLGAIHATNITPDRDTGIGAYSLADFDRACATAWRPVVAACTRPCPTRPTPSSATTTCARCTRFSCTACNRPSSQHPQRIPWPLNLRWPIALWNGLFAPTAPTPPSPARMRCGTAAPTSSRGWPLRQLPHAARPGVQREGPG